MFGFINALMIHAVTLGLVHLLKLVLLENLRRVCVMIFYNDWRKLMIGI